MTRERYWRNICARIADVFGRAPTKEEFDYGCTHTLIVSDPELDEGFDRCLAEVCDELGIELPRGNN